MVGCYFGLDEVFFDVVVDFVCCAHGGGVLGDGLGVDFVFVVGEEVDEIEYVVGGMNVVILCWGVDVVFG